MLQIKELKFIKLLLLAAVALSLLWVSSSESSAAWYNNGWSKRIKITIDDSKVNGSVLNFPVYVDLSAMPASFTDNCLANGTDLRVTKSDGTTEVAREVVWLNRTTNGGELHFVANGTLSNAANSDYYLYYGNGDATEPSANATYGKNKVWVNSYAGVWHLHEAVNNTASGYADSTSNVKHGTGTSMAITAPDGKLSGKAQQFDGSADYISTTYVLPTSNFTYSFWGNSTATNSNNRPFGAADYNAGLYGSSVLWGHDAANKLYVVFRQGSNVSTYDFNPTVTGLASGWHQVVIRSSSTAGADLYYDNGRSATTNSLSTSITTGSLQARFGRDSNQGTGGFDGKIDEFRISTVVRNGSWIKTEYRNQNSPSTFYSIGSAEILGNPTVSSFSPADGATGVVPSANLVITFNEPIDIQTGNITIKKSSDNSTVETISVSGGLVTGNGTTSITINPSSTLAYDTSYYVQIDATAFDDNCAESYAGISDTTTWNFTTNAWYNVNWARRIPITINASKINGSVLNFPIYVDLSSMPASFTDDCLTNGADLRVTKSDGTTEVAREVVWLNRTTNGGELHFVANGTLTNASNGLFYLYYKYSAATEPSASATYGKNKVWVNSYIGIWHLNEDPDGGASSTIDSTSNVNHGTPTNMSSEDPVTGKVGNALDFDGTNEYITMNDQNELESLASMSITAWFKTDSVSGERPVFTKELIYKSDINPLARFLTGNNWAGTITYSDGNVSTATWYHYAAKNDGTTKSLFLNGTKQADTDSGGNVSSNSNAVMIGTYASGSVYFDGIIDEVRLANVALSTNWIKTEYNNQNSPSTFYSIGTVENVVDITNPTVSSFSPSDGAYAVSITANLVITFSEEIDIQTGNITIKNGSNNSTVETISVSGGLVTGNGTTQITINPSSNLAYSRDYYVQIDATAFDDMSGNSYAGISDTTTWNFTTRCSTPAAGWYGCAWGKRVKITIDDSKVNGSVANFPIYLNLNGMSASFFDDVLTNGADLRVTKSNGTTEVAREVVWLNKTSNAGELHYVANGTLSNAANSDYYLYYGNGTATEPSASATYGKNNVWVNSYVGVWHLQEAVNNTASGYADSTSNANHGNGTSMAVTAPTGKLSGLAQDFDGSADYITFGTTNRPTNTFTYEAWIYPRTTHEIDSESTVTTTGTSGQRYAFDPENKSADAGAGLSVGTNGISNYEHASSYMPPTAVYSGSINAAWSYIQVVYSSKQPKIYHNGVLVRTGLTSAKTTVYAPRRIARELSYGALDGIMDEVRISSVARNGSWIKTQYNNHSAPATFYTAGSAEGQTATNNPTATSNATFFDMGF